MARQVEVMKPGLYTTVQDIGRTGYQQFGIVAAGAMDSFSLQVGNMLVGNDPGEAGLEVTLYGPELLFRDEVVLAICGADLGAMIASGVASASRGSGVSHLSSMESAAHLSHGTRRAPLWTSFTAYPGDRLRFTSPQTGARAYVAFAGGIDVPLVLGSRSTYARAAMGGFEGRPLQRGDVLRIGASSSDSGHSGRSLAPHARPSFAEEETIRVILGPQADYFTDEGLLTFLSSSYLVTEQSDRMGYRLQGPEIGYRCQSDIISDAIVYGSVQVPPDGNPILLLADRQTTGGYPKVATVISADHPRLGQLKAGDTVTFQAVSIEEAQQLYKEQARLLRTLFLTLFA